MRNIVLILVLLVLTLSACIGREGPGENLGEFSGGNNAIRLSFVPHSPPAEVTARGTASEGSEFDAIVTVENVGETDIDANELVLKMSGFFPSEFGTDDDHLSETIGDTLEGVSSIPGSSDIRGDVIQIRFPTEVQEEFKYQNSLAGSQSFPFRVTACYPYETRVLSQICLMEDFTSTSRSVCSPVGSKTVSNSGSPVHVTSVRQSVAGSNTLILSFNVAKVGTSDIFKGGSAKCADGFSNKDKIHVSIDLGLSGENIECKGLSGENPGTTTFSGELTLVEGVASFTCIKKLSGSDQVDSVKTFSMTLSYYARDSITKNVLVRHVI